MKPIDFFNKVLLNPWIVLIIALFDFIDIAEQIFGYFCKDQPIDLLNIIGNIVIVIWLIYLMNGLKRFNKAVINSIHNQLLFNQSVYESNPELLERYNSEIEILSKRLNYSTSGKLIDDLFTFDTDGKYDLKLFMEYYKKREDINRK